MSEEILKALMQLFAIISKQDEGTSVEERDYVKLFLLSQLEDDLVGEYLALFDKKAGIDKLKEKAKNGDDPTPEGEEAPKIKRKLTSVGDSVRTLGICKKINKTLTQKQKIVVLVRLFELINAEKKVTEQRVAIIETAANVFNISEDELQQIRTFVLLSELSKLDLETVCMVRDGAAENITEAKHIGCEGLEDEIIILKVNSVDLYFMKYLGTSELNLNGRIINNARIYLFANGSTIRPSKGRVVYYSDIAARFLMDASSVNISFNVKALQYKFPNGGVGLHEVNLSETQGKLCGLMGASGAGKTTLLNVMAGLYTPSEGQVLLNGHDLHHESDKVEGVIGYIPQDDLLIEELTVYQNLYYNAKLCFRDLAEEELQARVSKVLGQLGLGDQSHLRVGNPLDKTISGGQRKRLNIALELIREPSVLFVDEPTSGLSSRDSENVMDLLRELTLKGKLIFVVIHQPSSDIYKMFDKIILLDTGGWQTYYGNPVEAIMYFKRIDHQINAEVGECQICGNVNPELLFNIVEAKVVDEYGQYTEKRKISPQRWNELFRENFNIGFVEDVDDQPPRSLHLPPKLKQFAIFLTRDFLAKKGNKQYVYLNLLISPVLAFFLSIIIRYTSGNGDGTYIFRDNDNIPAYIFMCILVSMFVGLTVSAEEIFKDQKILKRESFLNLSRSGYLFSKMAILFGLSAVQSALFVLIGNNILGMTGLNLDYWFMLFTVACFANVLGLNISSAFNSAVTIYILIPIILIPQMILGGAMFDYDKLNRILGKEGQVPFVADMMAGRWAYEALIVNQFINNEHEKQFYDLEKKESFFNYKKVYVVETLRDGYRYIGRHFPVENDSMATIVGDKLQLIQNTLASEQEIRSVKQQVTFMDLSLIKVEGLTDDILYDLGENLIEIEDFYTGHYNRVNLVLNSRIDRMQETPEDKDEFLAMRNRYQNKYLRDLVKKTYNQDKMVIEDCEMVQLLDPIYKSPEADHALDYRAHFYSPEKRIFGAEMSTFWFNAMILWVMTLILYFTLYYDLLKESLYLFNKISVRKKSKKD
jgi:ABC-type multidrug transport system ATPase subunit